ncbi:MAG: SpoIIE family protein phosphatase [Clostridia bacterium]|nr:SpoIIE family protein phosphatase [Clostridia bacterium]
MKAVRESIKQSARYNSYIFLASIILSALAVFLAAYFLEHEFSQVMSVASYLTWHNLFEFISILVSFSIFAVSYYTYEQTRRLRSIFIGNILLLTGMLDAFHTLSFKGMPDFFVANDGANRATTLWIISRLIISAGFFASCFIPKEKRSLLNRKIFIIPSLAASVLILVTVTYYPEVFPLMFDEKSGITGIKKILEILVIVLFLLTTAKFLYEYEKTRDYLIVMLAAALILGVFSEWAFVSYKNDVHNIYNYLGHVYKFVSYFIIFRVIFIYNVKQPYIELSLAKNELKEYAENLDRTVEKRTQELRLINQRLLEDLEYARDIQKAILPSTLPKEQGVSFCARYFPAERVSGDFYNIFKIDENNIGMYIGDVAGHGVPAAMLMVFLNQSIKTISEANEKKSEILKPSEVLKSLYTSFNRTNFKEDVYVVLIYAVYNIKDKRLTYSSAGINVPPLIIKKDTGVTEMEVKGFPICKFIEYYSAEYADETLQLKKGDKIFFYTDGLVEAENEVRELFGENRLKGLLRENREYTCLKLIEKIEKTFFRFLDKKILKDDITFFVMEVQ